MEFDNSNQYARLGDDARSMYVLRDIANSLDSNIQMEADYPSQHESGRLPVLDLEVWIDVDNKIQHSFYKKSISSPYLILYRSAVSSRNPGEVVCSDGSFLWAQAQALAQIIGPPTAQITPI